MNPMDVLAPNYLGDSLSNSGIEELTLNRGIGVAEVTPANEEASSQRNEASNPGAIRDSLRTAKAREFGKTKETVGF